MTNQDYPKFIQNKPTGKDSLEGKSSERIAKTIEKHIEKINITNNSDAKIKLPQIIGLEGDWGSGKSNVIRKLKTNLEKKYYLFEYDAWGHQEDLQRRSFLETLTDDLIFANNGTLLPELCSKKNKDGEFEKWTDKLKYLFSKKRETKVKTKPEMSSGIIGSLLVLVTTPIATAIGNDDDFCFGIKLLITAIPIIIAIIVWLIASAIKKKLLWKELFQLYGEEKIEDLINETISENEPSVREFKAWMNDLSNDLKKNLIIVFDNMDRLPSEKVKELWSSIHTFFSEDGYKNIWVIIPYDKNHLANAFNEEKTKKLNNETKELTCQFITKTFPIIYRVASPVITDKKLLFNDFFEEAFGNTEDLAKETIQRIFLLHKSNFTPRDVIAFINELVSLKLAWLEEISLVSIALFVIKKDQIIDKPLEEILSGNYLDKVKKIILNNEQLQGEMAALTYGISVSMAKQIPLKQYLQNSLKNEKGFDINKYADHKHFNIILDDEIKELDEVLLDNAILSLSDLEEKYSSSITKIWDYIVEVKINMKFEKQLFEDSHKVLLLNAGDKHKDMFLKYICENLRNFEEFKGDSYFNAMQSLDNYILEKKLNIETFKYLAQKQVDPETFIYYLYSSKEKYKLYQITTDNDKLNDYLIESFPTAVPNMDFIEFLINDKSYTFSRLQERIELSITNGEIDFVNLSVIFKAYKFISKEIPLKIQLTKSQITALLNTVTDKKSETYFDLVSMGLIQSIDTLYVGGLDDKIAERIEFYADYGSLLTLSVSWPSDLLLKSLKKITEKPITRFSEINTIKILPSFEHIKNSLGVDESVLIIRLDALSNSLDTITISNIATVIPDYNFYKITSVFKNKLTEHLNKVALSKLEAFSVEELYANINISTDYWMNCAFILIQNNVIKLLPDNFTELSKKLLKDISRSPQLIPKSDSIIGGIINKTNKTKLLPTIKGICEDFCNKTIMINPELFIYFVTNFDFINKMNSRYGEITRNIINVVINNPICLNIILDNSTNYIKIINESSDDSEDLKTNIRQLMLGANYSEKLQEFAKSIGINLESETNIVE